MIAAIASGSLAGVFATSARRKLHDRGATRAAMVGLGLPVGVGDSLAALEALTALGLVMERHTPWSAIAALGLLSVFTVFVGLRVARDERAPCPCFGASDAPLGWSTMARNVGLIALAVLATGSRDDAYWLAPVSAVVVFGALSIPRR